MKKVILELREDESLYDSSGNYVTTTTGMGFTLEELGNTEEDKVNTSIVLELTRAKVSPQDIIALKVNGLL